MNAIELLTQTLQATHEFLKGALADFSDADMLVRPVPGANHAAWQLTHLIASEIEMMTGAAGVAMPPLDERLAKVVADKESAKLDDPAAFLTKAQLLALFAQVREATIAGVKTLSESDLDRQTGWEYAPNIGQFLSLVAGHLTMHMGQVQVIRRKLGKPVLF